jgi:RNA-binding protein NOB1
MEPVCKSKRVAEYLVIDTAGFIKNAPLHEFGQELITLHDVIAEIRDKATKQRLQALPYELTYREPDTASLQKG